MGVTLVGMSFLRLTLNGLGDVFIYRYSEVLKNCSRERLQFLFYFWTNGNLIMLRVFLLNNLTLWEYNRFCYQTVLLSVTLSFVHKFRKPLTVLSSFQLNRFDK